METDPQNIGDGQPDPDPADDAGADVPEGDEDDGDDNAADG